VVEHKDVVLAILPASAALAGLVLVFLGLVASATASFPGGTKKEIVARARRPVWAVLVSFGLGLGCAGVATWWLLLLHHDNHSLYLATVWLFFAQLGSLAVATGWAVLRSLWG
jgi:hypothetical protein